MICFNLMVDTSKNSMQNFQIHSVGNREVENQEKLYKSSKSNERKITKNLYRKPKIIWQE